MNDSIVKANFTILITTAIYIFTLMIIISIVLMARWADWYRGFNLLESSRHMWLETGARVPRMCTPWCRAAQRRGWLTSADQLEGRSESTFSAQLWASIGD